MALSDKLVGFSLLYDSTEDVAKETVVVCFLTV